MANDNVKNAAKNGLPFIVVTFVCGYATDAIPHIFVNEELRDWAYRSVPMLSLALLFIIRTLRDFGGMSFTGIMYSMCSSPEKKKLLAIINDVNAGEEVKCTARERYDLILKKEMELGSRLLTYISQWSVFKKSPVPPQSIE